MKIYNDDDHITLVEIPMLLLFIPIYIYDILKNKLK
jgi:hypothetical protein